MNYCLLKQFSVSNSPYTPFKFYLSGNFHKSRAFNLKLEKLICKKVLTFVVLDNYFSDLLTDGQI